MKKSINDFLVNLSLSVAHPNIIYVYRKGVYLFIILFTSIQLSIASELWGPTSLLPIKFYDGSLLFQSLNLLAHRLFAPYYLIFAISLIVACLLALFSTRQRLLSIVIYFLSANLYHRTITIQNGGGDLLMLQLFFLVLMNENSVSMKEGRLKIISIAITNVAFFASQIQVLLVYIVSVGYKLLGTHWIEGSALHYVLLNDEYSVDFIKDYVFKWPVFFKLSTWVILLFQLLFPILVWIKKAKPILFGIGIVIHLSIAFLMGIVDFGILMILMYLLFCSEKWSANIKKRISFEFVKSSIS